MATLLEVVWNDDTNELIDITDQPSPQNVFVDIRSRIDYQTTRQAKMLCLLESVPESVGYKILAKAVWS